MKCAKRLVLFTLIAINFIEQPAPEVTIDQGMLTGKISDDGSFYEYLGIPYATTNSETRFQAPLPAPKWDGIFKAVDEHYSCMQPAFGTTIGVEDCLKVNVYVPANVQRPIPVMVFIHGGAFVVGSGGKFMYGPEFIVQHDVILVTFNYRLGPLGFMCLGIKEAPGNAGLKDQVAALRWVKKNIAAFGGDNENITIFGQSAGGTSTSFMIASNATDGLFDRAIVQSGSSLANWAVNRNPVWTAHLLAKNMGYGGKEDPYELHQFLSKAPLKELISTRTKKPWEQYFETELIHLPCVEKSFPDIEAVVTDVPYNLMTASDRKNISVIYGSTDKEGLFLIAEETNETLWERNARYMFAADLEFSNEEEVQKVSDDVKKFYFGDAPISIDKVNNASDICTHLYFEIPELLEADIIKENRNVKVYNYYFKYDGSRNAIKYMTGNKKHEGACHGDELFYLFQARLLPFRVGNEDKVIIDWITKLWTNFAKYGDPTPEMSENLPIKWVPSSKEEINALVIDEKLSMGPVPNREAYDLWKSIYTKYRKRTWGY